VQIYVIRHGETPSNAARIIQTPETPLSALGEEQAERLAARLATCGITRIVSSDLPRAAMTAQRLASTTRAPVDHDALLQERNFGDVRGTAYRDLDGDLFAPEFEPPGGESWATFHARVARAWERVAAIAAATTGDLAVVTHGLVCFSLASHQFTLPAGESAPQRFGNTSVTIVDGAPPWRVATLNCGAHLEGDPG
jgi:probable phosphoglycerate mutase